MRLPARWRWSARCECGRMVSALRWKLHGLRRGHQIEIVTLKGPGRLDGTLTFHAGSLDETKLPGWRRTDDTEDR